MNCGVGLLPVSDYRWAADLPILMEREVRLSKSGNFNRILDKSN